MDFQFNNNILFTDRLKLRPLTIDDAKDMFEYTSQPEAARFLSWNPHEKLEETKRFLENVVALYENNNTEFSWAIELIDTGKMIGVVKLFEISKNNQRAEVSYILNSRFQGKGYINEAISAVINFAFTEMKLLRVQARCTSDNKASEKVMQKANMQYEGLLRKYWVLKGEPKDVVLYAITK
jgi:ribosomal-protein-alanine N-acetyltransferase